MKTTAFIIFGLVTSFCLGFFFNPTDAKLSFARPAKLPGNEAQNKKQESMKLGAFSISLSVKDLAASKQFYENLGFTEFGGGMEQNYLIMKNGNALVGLFQGMFQGNILTFNPGWDENAKNMKKFDDVRAIQHHLKDKGVSIRAPEADEKTTGPASFMVTDPDGNLLLFDQHR